ncbi:hypothetical protein Nepgr_003780 [Nepenthes gracilis]|uniref:Ninja-family protein n=1 Tax=Nepenthes gracilis TaxID=150966 RepID=A0AAD3S073_NEPGR|nr:hypothetical protein Nepgr_003780 [Nepenthes gracilis]
MSETEKGGGDLPTGNYPFSGHLLERFTAPINKIQRVVKSEEEVGEEIELGLGLSLNGQFGVDPKMGENLIRSSSIPDFLNPRIRDIETTRLASDDHAPLTRACSLPTESDEEWRKRKELQTLRRMEAKRKRFEKQKNLRAARCQENGEEANGIDGKKNNGLPRHVWLPTWTNGIKVGESEPNGGRGDAMVRGGGVSANFPRRPLSYGSPASQGSGSSGIMEFESPIAHEANKSEAKKPTSVHLLPASSYQKPVVPIERAGSGDGKSAESVMGKPATRLGVSIYGTSENMRKVLSDMPCVSTIGDGPMGKRIQGFLYRYKKGEDVRIVCVCHGSFLTPAEFVKHAGGGEVEHPLRRIVVSPSPL